MAEGDSNPVKVLCLSYEYPPVGGGGGRVAARVNAALVSRGHEVRVQTAGMRHLPSHQMVDGVAVYRAESFRRKEDTCSVLEMALYLVTSFFPAWSHVRRWKPDVIHAHFAVPTGALAWLVSRLTGVPYVVTAHLGDVPGGVPEQTAGLFKLVGPLTRPIWSSANGLTAVSSFVSQLARLAYGRDARVIFNGIELGPTPEFAVAECPRILMVGRLSIQKNPLLAIDALAKIRDLNWQFEVIGDGPLRAQMETAANQAGISERIHFRGWLDANAVRQAMSQSEILLMTSSSEGLPVVAVEALASGLALVLSDIPGVSDVIRKDWNGCLCPLNAEGFARNLARMLKDPAFRLQCRRNAREHAQQFELSATVDQYEMALAATITTNRDDG